MAIRSSPRSVFITSFSIEAIANTPSNSVIALFFEEQNLDIIAHLRLNNIRFALYVSSNVEAVLAENLRATYLIVTIKNGSEIQKVAEHYLFDAKVLGYCEEEENLENLIEMRLDGAIFAEAIIKYVINLNSSSATGYDLASSTLVSNLYPNTPISHIRSFPRIQHTHLHY